MITKDSPISKLDPTNILSGNGSMPPDLLLVSKLSVLSDNEYKYVSNKINYTDMVSSVVNTMATDLSSQTCVMLSTITWPYVDNSISNLSVSIPSYVDNSISNLSVFISSYIDTKVQNISADISSALMPEISSNVILRTWTTTTA